jgi:hypothetical protein
MTDPAGIRNSCVYIDADGLFASSTSSAFLPLIFSPIHTTLSLAKAGKDENRDEKDSSAKLQTERRETIEHPLTR